jgi:hypothetical protein
MLLDILIYVCYGCNFYLCESFRRSSTDCNLNTINRMVFLGAEYVENVLLIKGYMFTCAR